MNNKQNRKNFFQHLFINNNHWILVQIHNSIVPNSFCTIYDLKKPLTRTILNDIIQLLLFLTIVEHSLYKYASVMQQMNSSSQGLFKITYATNITFVIDPEKI